MEEGSPVRESRPDDCPAGLWDRMKEMLTNPEAFIKENPTVYEELKADWERQKDSQLNSRDEPVLNCQGRCG